MFSSILYFTWIVIQLFIIINVVLPFLLCFIQCIRQLVKKQATADEELYEEKDYAIIVSAGRNTDELSALLSSLARLDYTNYMVYVLANSNSIIHPAVARDKVVILQAPKMMYSPVRLHRFAVENFRRPHTHVVLLDSRSLVDKDYLSNLSGCFHQGYQAVQSRRMIKNRNHVYHITKYVGNCYHDFFKGRLAFEAGASAVPFCSGSAFTIRLYKQCLRKMTPDGINFITGLQSAIIESGHQVAFAERAVVYDNKKAGIHTLMQQHAYNINTWLRQFAFHFRMMANGIMYGNRNQFLSGALLLQLPLFTSFIASVFCIAISLWMNSAVSTIWIVCLLLFPAYLLIATLHSFISYFNTETGISETDDTSLSTISLYEERSNDYDVVAQMI